MYQVNAETIVQSNETFIRVKMEYQTTPTKTQHFAVNMTIEDAEAFLAELKEKIAEGKRIRRYRDRNAIDKAQGRA